MNLVQDRLIEIQVSSPNTYNQNEGQTIIKNKKNVPMTIQRTQRLVKVWIPTDHHFFTKLNFTITLKSSIIHNS